MTLLTEVAVAGVSIAGITVARIAVCPLSETQCPRIRDQVILATSMQ